MSGINESGQTGVGLSASELDLVRSGLEDTMRNSYTVISEVWNKNKNVADLRTAAMLVAVKRVMQSYTSLGM